MKIIFTLIVILFTSYGVLSQDNQRIFKDDLLIEKQNYFPSDYDLFRPVIFALTKSNFIIYDYSQSNLYSLEKVNNDLLSLELGGGKGSGPKEFRNPTDICVTNLNSKELTIVSDSDLTRVSIWDLEFKTFIKSFKTKRFVPYRLTCYNDRIFVYNSSGSKDGNYLIYDFEGNLLKGLKDNTLSKDGFLDSGYIVADSSFIYFVSEGKPEIKRYNYINDAPIKVSSTIEKVEAENKLSISKTDEEITTKRDKEFKYQSRGVGLLKDFLVVFHSGRKDAHGSIIDFYNKYSLNYEYSVKLNHVFSSIDVNDNRLLINAYDFDRKESEFYVFEIDIK